MSVSLIPFSFSTGVIPVFVPQNINLGNVPDSASIFLLCRGLAASAFSDSSGNNYFDAGSNGNGAVTLAGRIVSINNGGGFTLGGTPLTLTVTPGLGGSVFDVSGVVILGLDNSGTGPFDPAADDDSEFNGSLNPATTNYASDDLPGGNTVESTTVDDLLLGMFGVDDPSNAIAIADGMTLVSNNFNLGISKQIVGIAAGLSSSWTCTVATIGGFVSASTLVILATPGGKPNLLASMGVG